MSEYHVVEIGLDNIEALQKSLKEMGHTVEVHEKPVDVNGWAGRKWGKAHVVVRKKAGFMTDFGFEKVGDKFVLRCDSGDKGRINIKQLTQLHGKHKIKSALHKQPSKYKVHKEEVDKNGNIHLKVRCRVY